MEFGVYRSRDLNSALQGVREISVENVVEVIGLSGFGLGLRSSGYSKLLLRVLVRDLQEKSCGQQDYQVQVSKFYPLQSMSTYFNMDKLGPRYLQRNECIQSR